MSVRDILLVKRGIVFIEDSSTCLPHEYVQAVELELAVIGYVVSSNLRDRLTHSTLEALTAFRDGTSAALLEHAGANQKHQPLFRRFPEDIPDDTEQLWWQKVLVHFVQAAGQPCLFCGRTGTTHVLDPCRHVVCDYCFDGANYRACPICEHHVDESSPFFLATPERSLPSEKVTFRLLTLGEDETAEAGKLFLTFCERKQALSPDDRKALICIVRTYQARVLEWLPEKIPLKENVAVIFGTLFQECSAEVVLPIARRYMTTATDVLRFIAVLSGTDGSLLRETVFKIIGQIEKSDPLWTRIAKLLGALPPRERHRKTAIPVRICRFKVAKMARSLRRSLLSLLDEMPPERLIEDMLRHRSYWVWVGEFLHPHEYAQRFPSVARAFQIVRKKASDGTPAPEFRTWYSRLEKSMVDGNVNAMLSLFNERPGEFARRFDHALRAFGKNQSAANRVLEAFVQKIPALATPVLLTLRSHLPKRREPASIRVYWPKGRVAKGVSSEDRRAVLPGFAIDPAVKGIDAELLQRFSMKPHFAQCVIDEELRSIVVPFNERTASSSAVSLPRGSRVAVPVEKTLRLFLHWCQPEKSGDSSDLDLSVALYDQAWQYIGVCSYYQLKLLGDAGAVIAQSAGDLRDAPWPDGASEFVDLNCEAALAQGSRYAVMVVNNYYGLPFSLLERGFAGLMLRDDTGGTHFDLRTVALKFALDGENGVFLPLVIDLHSKQLHWLDVQSKGGFEFNNVETSNSAITKICPELMTYFASGVRPNMYEFALLHAASRCERVVVRGGKVKCFERNLGESPFEFFERILAGLANSESSDLDLKNQPVLAFLYRGDLELPENSSIYALFREQVIPSLAAADLLS